MNIFKVLIILYPFVFFACDKSRLGTEGSPDNLSSDSVYDQLPDSLYYKDGTIDWEKLMVEFIETKGLITGTKIDSSYSYPEFSKLKKEQFKTWEYNKFQNFDLWNLRGSTLIDSAIYLHIRNDSDNISIRFSDHTYEPMIVMKTKSGWILDYEYKIDPEMYNGWWEFYDLYVYRHTTGFLSDTINVFINEFSMHNMVGEKYMDIWIATATDSKYIQNLKFEKSLYERPFIISKPGFKEFLQLLINAPNKYFSKEIKISQSKREMINNDEVFNFTNGEKEVYPNPLIIGSGGMLNQRNLENDVFVFNGKNGI